MKNKIFKTTIFALACLAGTTFALTKLSQNSLPTELDTSIVLAKQLIQTNDNELTPNSIKESYENSLREREEAVRTDIIEKTGITREEWVQRKNEFISTYKASGNSDAQNARKENYLLSPATKQLVQGILQKIGLDPKTIHLLKRDDNPSNPASACTNVIFINEEFLTSRPLVEQKHIIAHEGHHIVFQDTADKHAIKSLIKDKYGDVSLEHKELLNTFSRFCEERADIYAHMQGEEYREGGIASLTYFTENYGTKISQTHPSFAKRTELAYAIDTAFNTCKAA